MLKPILDKRDIQKFVKKLRYYFQNGKSIKYYIVGEYGDKSGRPHWHCIFFNTVLKPGQDIYKILNSLWPSIWQIGDNKGACYTYMLKYFLKPELKTDISRKPVVLISKGIGLSYLLANNGRMLNYHRKSRSLTVVTFDGQKAFMPRYLREKIWPDELQRKYVVCKAIEKLKSDGIIKDQFQMALPSGVDTFPLASRIQFLNNRQNAIAKIQHHF